MMRKETAHVHYEQIVIDWKQVQGLDHRKQTCWLKNQWENGGFDLIGPGLFKVKVKCRLWKLHYLPQTTKKKRSVTTVDSDPFLSTLTQDLSVLPRSRWNMSGFSQTHPFSGYMGSIIRLHLMCHGLSEWKCHWKQFNFDLSALDYVEEWVECERNPTNDTFKHICDDLLSVTSA